MATIGVLALQGAFVEHVAKVKELGVNAIEVRTPAELARCSALIIPGGESTAMGLIAERTGMLAPLRAWTASRKPTWGTCAGMIMLADAAEGQKLGGQALLGGMDVKVSRNYFGAQIASFEASLELAGEEEEPGLSAAVLGGSLHAAKRFRGIFIRAPAIMEVGPGARPVAWVRKARRDAQVPLLPSLGAAAVPATGSSTSAGSGGGAASPGAEGSPDSPPPRVCVAARSADGRFLVTAFHPELSDSNGWHALFLKMVAEAEAGTAAGGAASAAPAPKAAEAS